MPKMDKKDIKKLLDYADFDSHLQKLKNSLVELLDDDKVYEPMNVFIDGVENAKEKWLSNPSDATSFFEKCDNLADNAAKSPLKNHAGTSSLINLFVKAINKLASLISNEPLIKTDTYKGIKEFKQRVQDLKDEPEFISSPKIK